MDKRFIYFFISILLSSGVYTNAYAQRNNTWYFGNKAGISFNGGIPVALTNSAMDEFVSSATISDATGNLLFYTDGESVWNAQHQIMPNGTGLLGKAATQSALIIPKPGDCGLYYIFTTPVLSSNTLPSYSIVDMNEDGGLGNVVVKNTPIYHEATTERLTGTLHGNGKDYWIITQERGTNAILSYLVSSAGVSAPVITRAPALDFTDIRAWYTISAGYMKVSRDGKKLCFTGLQEKDDGTGNNAKGLTMLMDFNNLTGVVSNFITLKHSNNNGYGVEFSPDNTKLYVAEYLYPTKIQQYNITGNSQEAIRNSATIIAQSNNFTSLIALQIGPDNKIYTGIKDGGFLSVINSPNLPGKLCDYVDSVISLNGRTCGVGLPNTISFTNVIPDKISLGKDTAICPGASILLQTPSVGIYQWYKSTSGASPFLFYSNSSAVQITDTGYYVLELVDGDCPASDTIHIAFAEKPVIDLVNDTFTCEGNSISLDAGPGYSNYLWQDGSVSRWFSAKAAGSYTVTVKNQYGCFASDEIVVFVKPNPIIHLPSLLKICEPDTMLTPSSFTSYLWQDGSESGSFHVTNYGIYSVTVTDSNNCSNTTITEIVNDCPTTLFIPNAFTPNADGINDIFIPVIINISTIHLKIYNRWGMMVFETLELNKGWDGNYNGTIALPDVYVYMLEYSGNNPQSSLFTTSGNVTLMR